MELGRTAHVILGALALGRDTGYDIKALVDVSTRFFWAASYGQIYPELRRLEEAGLVAGSRERDDGRRRKAYRLTEAGWTELRRWLRSKEPLVLELRHEGLLKLFFSDVLSPQERADGLRRIARLHDDIAAELHGIRAGARAPEDRESRSCPLLVLEFGIAYHEFVARWCSEAGDRLAATGGS